MFFVFTHASYIVIYSIFLFSCMPKNMLCGITWLHSSKLLNNYHHILDGFLHWKYSSEQCRGPELQLATRDNFQISMGRAWLSWFKFCISKKFGETEDKSVVARVHWETHPSSRGDESQIWAKVAVFCGSTVGLCERWLPMVMGPWPNYIVYINNIWSRIFANEFQTSI